MSAIIVYFSRTGENYVSGAIKKLDVGNTEAAAEMLQKLTGADMFRIEPVMPYSDIYNDCIEQAKQDKERDARPEIVSCPESLDKYDTIFSATQITGARCLCACSHFLNTSTSQAKLSNPSAPTRAAEWAAAKATLKGYAKALTSKRDFPSTVRG